MKKNLRANKKKIEELMKLSKKILDKNVYKKLKKVKDKEELLPAIKYSLIAALEREHHKLEKEIRENQENNKDVNIIKNKSILVPSKIKHFSVEFSKDEFYKVYNLLKDIKKELKNV